MGTSPSAHQGFRGAIALQSPESSDQHRSPVCGPIAALPIRVRARTRRKWRGTIPSLQYAISLEGTLEKPNPRSCSLPLWCPANPTPNFPTGSFWPGFRSRIWKSYPQDSIATDPTAELDELSTGTFCNEVNHIGHKTQEGLHHICRNIVEELMYSPLRQPGKSMCSFHARHVPVEIHIFRIMLKNTASFQPLFFLKKVSLSIS